MKVMTVIGTRPEGIKMAPILQALEYEPFIDSVFVNTGQHAELLDQVLSLFGLTPDYQLRLMKNNQHLTDLSARMIVALREVMEKEQPNIVLVHGDTTTTFIASYTAFLLGIPVGHVEAGLRTYDLTSPFPEEANRQLAGRLASFHFAATAANRQNLLDEGINGENIFVVGNSVIDALQNISTSDASVSDAVRSLFPSDKRTILLTTHRRENLHQLKEIYDGVLTLLEEHPDAEVVFPVHKNPLVLAQANEFLGRHPRVHLVEPLDYADFAYSMKHAYFIITDSGGIQEEAPSFGTPVLVARDTTERGEGVQAGTVKLVGTNREQVVAEGTRLLTDAAYHASFKGLNNPYGDGHTAPRIVDILKKHLSCS